MDAEGRSAVTGTETEEGTIIGTGTETTFSFASRTVVFKAEKAEEDGETGGEGEADNEDECTAEDEDKGEALETE